MSEAGYHITKNETTKTSKYKMSEAGYKRSEASLPKGALRSPAQEKLYMSF